jgi:hypothetical protein
MSAQPTPGPWAVQDIGINCLRITASIPTENVPHEFRDYYSSIATVTQRDAHPRYDAGISRQTCAANARLMAAAPDLLEALRLIADGDVMGGGHSHIDTVLAYQNIARAAITKAEGGAA